MDSLFNGIVIGFVLGLVIAHFSHNPAPCTRPHRKVSRKEVLAAAPHILDLE